jgi:sec-independent protein translocase protein TatA
MLLKLLYISNVNFIVYKLKNRMNTMLLMNFFGPEMIVVFFAILLLFGGKKIPELMRGLGRGVREFNDARANVTKELQAGMKEAEQERIKIEEDKK